MQPKAKKSCGATIPPPQKKTIHRGNYRIEVGLAKRVFIWLFLCAPVLVICSSNLVCDTTMRRILFVCPLLWTVG